MEAGKSYLILCGRGFAFCGRVAAEVRPNVYKLAQASMVCTKRDCSWFDLAEGNGEARQTMTSRFSAGEVVVGPEIHFAVPWVGDLPEVNVG